MQELVYLPKIETSEVCAVKEFDIYGESKV